MFEIIWIIGILLGLWSATKFAYLIHKIDGDWEIIAFFGWFIFGIQFVPTAGFFSWIGWTIYRWHEVIGYYMSKMPIGKGHNLDPRPSPETKRQRKAVKKRRKEMQDLAELVLLEVETDNPITDPEAARKVLVYDDTDARTDAQILGEDALPILEYSQKYAIKQALRSRRD